MSAETNIDTAIDALTAEIAELSATTATTRKPSYSLNGVSVSWESYFTSRVQALERLLTVRASLGAPVQVVTQAIT